MNGYVDLPGAGDVHWKSPVASAAALPAVGNLLGDARVGQDLGFVYVWNGTTWINNGGSGTVTSVALSAPASILSVSGSPITGAGTLTLSLATQTANLVWAGPASGGAATPTFRALVSADIPTSLLNITGSIRKPSFIQMATQGSAPGLAAANTVNFYFDSGLLPKFEDSGGSIRVIGGSQGNAGNVQLSAGAGTIPTFDGNLTYNGTFLSAVAFMTASNNFSVNSNGDITGATFNGNATGTISGPISNSVGASFGVGDINGGSQFDTAGNLNAYNFSINTTGLISATSFNNTAGAGGFGFSVDTGGNLSATNSTFSGTVFNYPNLGAAGTIAQFDGSNNLIGSNSIVAPLALPGITNGTDAAAGYVGEYIEAFTAFGSSVTLTTATPKTVASISLTAGDWDISGIVMLNGTLTGTQFIAAIGTVNNSLTSTTLGYSQVSTASLATATSDNSLSLSNIRQNLNSITVTIYLIAQASFTVGTAKAYGVIRARRIR